MILLLDSDKEGFNYCLRDSNKTVKQGTEQNINYLKGKLNTLNKTYEILTVGYLVQDCGRSVRQSVSELNSSLLENVEKDMRFGPSRDLPMKKVVNFGNMIFGNSRHLIFCGSAFYLNMPLSAIAYAIPSEDPQGVFMRSGRNGIIHEWASNKLTAIDGSKAGKCISIFLSERTDVVALKNGKPVTTTHGFSDLDGIMSQTGCGSIDTSIVLQMLSCGYSVELIYQVLSEESGFKSFLDKKLRLVDLITSKDENLILAKDILFYQIIKAIGSCCAILEGVDSIIFIGEDKEIMRDWAYVLLRQLEFLGLKMCNNNIDYQGLMTAADSPIQAHYFNFDKWSVLASLLKKAPFLKKHAALGKETNMF